MIIPIKNCKTNSFKLFSWLLYLIDFNLKNDFPISNDFHDNFADLNMFQINSFNNFHDHMFIIQNRWPSEEIFHNVNSSFTY